MISLHAFDLKEVLEQEVISHSAWHGHLVGMDAEELLRGQANFSYLIREGEERFHYYLSYVIESPFLYKHQPFTLAWSDLKDSSKLGWGYRNGHVRWATKLEELLSQIMHRPLERCSPILKRKIR